MAFSDSGGSLDEGQLSSEGSTRLSPPPGTGRSIVSPSSAINAQPVTSLDGAEDLSVSYRSQQHPRSPSLSVRTPTRSNNPDNFLKRRNAGVLPSPKEESEDELPRMGNRRTSGASLSSRSRKSTPATSPSCSRLTPPPRRGAACSTALRGVNPLENMPGSPPCDDVPTLGNPPALVFSPVEAPKATDTSFDASAPEIHVDPGLNTSSSTTACGGDNDETDIASSYEGTDLASSKAKVVQVEQVAGGSPEGKGGWDARDKALEEAQQTIEQQQEQIKELSAERDALKKKLVSAESDLDRTVAQLADVMHRMNAEVEKERANVVSPSVSPRTHKRTPSGRMSFGFGHARTPSGGGGGESEEDVMHLKLALSKSQKETMELQQQVAQLKSALKDFEAKDQMGAETALLEKKLKDAREDLIRLEDRKRTTQHSIDQLEQQRVEQQNVVSELDSKVAGLRKQREKLESEVAELERRAKKDRLINRQCQREQQATDRAEKAEKDIEYEREAQRLSEELAAVKVGKAWLEAALDRLGVTVPSSWSDWSSGSEPPPIPDELMAAAKVSLRGAQLLRRPST